VSASNTSTEPVSLTDRINDAATITLNGAMFQWRSRAALYTTEQLGAVNIGYASSLIDFAAPGTSVNQADITMASLAQVAGEHGTVRFLNISGNVSALQRLFINNLNGVATTSIGAGLTNNIIGGWATYEREFATYTPGEGVAGLASNGYAGYSPDSIFTATATDNIRILLPVAGSTTTLTANTTLYTLNLQANTGATGNSTLDLGGKTLTVASGGLIVSPIATTASSNSISIIDGNLTAGTTSSPTDFYLHALSWLNGQATNTGNADVTVSANITDNSAGGSVSLVIDANNGNGTLAATNDVFISGVNTYTGGTFINSGRVDLTTPGADGVTTTATGSGNLTIAGGYSLNVGVFSDRNTRVVLGASSEINNNATVTIMGGATLDLNGFNQKVGGLVFNNEGGDAPTVTTGTGNLILNGNVHASGQNLGSVATISTTGSGTLNLGGSTRTFTVDPVQWNGESLNYLLPNLNVSGNVVGTGSEGIIKDGAGLLQLSGANTFTGGVNLTAGGLAIGASTNVTTRDPVTGVASAFTNGPLGTGVMTIGAGTFLTSTSSTNTVNNDYVTGGNFSLKGNLSLTLNGATTLPSGSTTISVDTVLTNLTLNGVIAGTDNTSALIKAGQGTLTLGNNNTFQGGITLNAGNLVMAGLNGGFASPIPGGTALINSSGALLSLLNNGGGNGTIITYSNDITLSGSITGAGLNIGNNGSNSNNIVEVANLNIASGQTLDVSGANGYQLRLLNVNTTGSTAALLNPALGTTIFVLSYGSVKPVNVGLGTVIFPEVPVINTASALSNGSTITGLNPVAPQAATLSTLPGDYVSGGLTASYYQFASTVAINSAIASGAGATGTFAQVGLGDVGGFNHPIGVTSTNFNGGISVQSGYLQIVSGGSYTFHTAADDSSILYIDGKAIISNATGGAAESAAGTTVYLSAGYHSIVYKQENASGATNSGGFHVLYSGPDTVNDQGTSPTVGNYEAIPASRLFAAGLSLATAGNDFLTAGQLTGGWNLAGGNRATVDTLGSVLNSTIDTLSIGDGTASAPTVLSIVSGTGGSIGTGWFGVTGTTSIGANTILNVGLNSTSGAGMLYLIGGVSDSGNGFVKTGSGSLIMGGSSALTGNVTVQAGTLVVAASNALTSGTTTISSSSATVTSGITSGSTQITMSSTTGRSVGELVVGTGIPQGAFITRIINSTTVEISDVATATNAALGAVYATGATLDLNGTTGVTGTIVLNGTGQVNPTTGNSTSLTTNSTVNNMLGGANAALWNSSPNAASIAGTILINSSNVQIGGQGDITLNGAVTASASNPLTKIGGNTLTLAADNSATLLGAIAVNSGILKVGNANALGATSAGTTVSSGGVLDFNGFSIAEPLTISGTGLTNFGLGVNSLGALINSSSTLAVLSGSLTLAANSSIGSSDYNSLSGVTEGDIELDGVISGNFTLTKVGTDTLTITNSANAYGSTNVNQGTVIVNGSGRLGTTGTVTVNGSGYNSGVMGSQLILDNTTTASSTRLGGLPVVLAGGLLQINGNASTAVNETLASNQSISINNLYNIITLSNVGTNVRLTATGTGTLTRGSNGTVLIRGTNLGAGAPGATNTNIMLATTPTFTGQSATSGKNMHVLSWVVVDPSATGNGTGSSVTFATWDATSGIRPLNEATEMDTTFTANNNIRLLSALTAGNATTVYTNTLVNSLTFESGGSLTINALRNVTVDSGGILAKASATISGTGSLTATTANNLSIFTMGSGTLLEVDVPVGGLYGAPSTGGLSKSGDGTLMLNAQNNYIGETRLNLGKLQLGALAPANNAIFFRFTEAPAPNATGTTLRADNFVVQQGSIFDLNGHSQTVGSLASTITQPGGGGIITNQAPGMTNFETLMTGTFTFAGSINDNLNFIRSGGSTLTLASNNDYVGTTLLMGGVTALQDQGRLSGGGTITINRSVLRWDDSASQALSDRLSTSTSATNANSSNIILNGGALYYISRGGTNGVATFSNLTLASNASFVQVNIGNGNVGTATMSFGSLIRQGTASVTFATTSGGLGDNPFITFATAPALTNGIIGAWATVLTTDPSSGAAFATYDPSTGVRPLASYMQTSSFATSGASDNLLMRDGAVTTVTSGGASVNTLTWNGLTANRALSFVNANDVLTLTAGGLLGGAENFSKTIGSTAVPGVITTSAPQLYLDNVANVLTINSVITGNFDLIATGLGRADLSPQITLANANTYVGTTYVNGVILNLSNPTGTGNAITGDLVISGGTTTSNGAVSDSAPILSSRVINRGYSDQIADTATVTVNGGGMWALNGYNDIVANLVFTSDGGSNGNEGARVETGTGVLTLTGNITATNLQQLGVIPLLMGNVNLAGTHSITVDNVTASMVGNSSQIGLALETNFVGGTTNLQKLGAGVLALGGQGNATTNVNVDVMAGTVVLTGTTSYTRMAITLESGTTLDMRGQSNLAMGSITGSGTIRNFNASVGGTLTLGMDNASTTFDGLFVSDFTAGLLNVTKAGTGSWTLTADNSAQLIGTLAVNAGSVILSGASARSGFINTLVDEGGTLTLDNSVNFLNDRLGGTTSIGGGRTLSMRGGVFNYIGSGLSNVSETLGTVTFLEGQSQWNLTGTTNNTVINISTLSASSTTNRGTGVINAGSSILGGALGAGSVNIVAATANLVGGGGVAGTVTMSIRPDLIGIDSTNATGGLLTSVATTGLRLLTASEYQILPGAGSGLGAVISGLTTSGSGVVQFSDITGLVAGQNLVAAVNGITAGSLVTGLGANTLTFGSNATSSAVGRFNLSVPATANVRTAAATQLYQALTVNSLTLDNGGGITSNGNLMNSTSSPLGLDYGMAGTLNTLTLTSGALVANAGNLGINNGALTAGGALLIVHALGDITINSAILGSGGIVKADGGTLTLGGRSYNTGATFVNEGTLKLNAGANTLLVASTASVPTVADLVVNGGTFDLNGYNQAVRQITVTDNNLLPGSGGSIVNSSATTATLFTAQSGSTTFAGMLGGTGGNNFNVDKTGNATWTLTSAATYTGSTTVRAGTLALQDSASIQGTSAINVNYATLTWNDTGISSVINRFGSAPITLTGGTIAISPRQEGEINNTFGSIILNAGVNVFNFATPERGGGFNITSPSLIQQNSSIFYVVNGTYTIGRSPLSVEGGQGPTMVFNTAPTLINNIIGGWAIYQGTDYLTYLPTQAALGGLGVRVLGDTGAGFANYNTNSTITVTTNLAGAGAANNVKYVTTTNSINFNISAPYTVNSLVINSTQAATPLTWTNTTDLLTLTSGGFLKTGNANFSLGGSLDSGRVTTGTASQSLYLYNNQAALTLNARVVDNGSPVTLVLSTANGGTFILPNPNASYTGGTIIDTATTSITATTAGAVIPAGGLTINNAAVNFTGGSTTLYGQIDPTSIITLNGGATLTLPNYTASGANTFSSIVFNDMGGTTTPLLALGAPAASTTARLVLSAANAITVVNDNLGTTPTISGTYTSGTQFASLEFSNASPVISVSGLSPMGLVISAAITQNAGMTGALSKMGSGSLVLSSASSNWTTGFNLNAGTLILDAASTGTPPAITSGPLGTGTLTIADGTTIQAGTAARTIGNAVMVNGSFTFGGTASTQNLTLSGIVNLGTSASTITVSSPQVTATISGKLTSGAGSGLTKAGDGTLILSGATNDYTGATIVSGGLLKYGAANAIPVTSAVSVLAGATLDINGGGASVTFASLSGSSSTTGGLITTSATSGTVTLTIGDSTDTGFGGAITNNVGSTLNLVKVGTGTLTLGGPDSYTGSTTINAGGITAAASNVLPNTTAVTLAAAAAVDTVTLDLNGNNDAIASLTYAGATGSFGVVQTGAGTLTLLGDVTYDATNMPDAATLSGNVSLGGSTRTFNVGDSILTTQELTVSAVISGATATDGVTKTGAGTLVFSGANTYTGKTAVNGGTLSISAENNLGTAPAAAVADQLSLNGGTLQTTADVTLSANRGVTIGSSGGTFDTAGGTTTTVSSVITGAGDISKVSAGTLMLNAVNTNTGAVNVNAGTLGGTGTLGGALNVNSGGTVAPGAAGAAGLLTVGGNLTVNSGGTLLMQLGGAALNDAASIQGNENSLNSLSPSVIAGWEAASSTLSDHIVINGTNAPVINGTIKIDPTFLNGYTPTYGDVFNLLDWSSLSSISGTTSFDFTGTVLSSGLAFNSQLFASNGIIVVVPEPGRVLLLLLGLAGLCLRRRRD
jgi:autotransporter-associated beta strand protein